MSVLSYLKYLRAAHRFKLQGAEIQREVRWDVGTKLGKKTKIFARADVRGSTVGDGTYVGWDAVLKRASLGKYCSVAPFSQVVYGRHPSSGFVSTHPAFFSNRKQAGFTYVSNAKFNEFRTTDEGFSVVVGHDVWLGWGCLLMEGIRIGTGAIVAAGSVVTKDVEPYAIVGGNPARFIRWRFSEEQRASLLGAAWWDWSEDVLMNRAELFENIDEFQRMLKTEWK